MPGARGVAWFLVLVIAIAAVRSYNVESDKSRATVAQTAAPQQREALAMRSCEAAKRFVTAQLKAPSTAKFPGCVFGANQYEIRATPDNKTVWVMGHVDSQNGFGAMLRSDFGVEMAYVAEGNKGYGEFLLTSVQIE